MHSDPNSEPDYTSGLEYSQTMSTLNEIQRSILKYIIEYVIAGHKKREIEVQIRHPNGTHKITSLQSDEFEKLYRLALRVIRMDINVDANISLPLSYARWMHLYHEALKSDKHDLAFKVLNRLDGIIKKYNQMKGI